MEEGSSVIIKSPRSPYNYPDDADITYVITTEEDLRLLVNFTQFSTEFSLDTVTIGEGANPYNEESVITTVSGFSLPPNIITESNATWLRFTSDSSINYAGFVANITAVSADSKC